MKANKSDDNLIWIDLEMTGLDPEKEKIIEIATIITDSDLNVIAEGPNIAIHQSNELLDSMDEWNVNQHTSSGLIDAVRTSIISDKEAEFETLDFISKSEEISVFSAYIRTEQLKELNKEYKINRIVVRWEIRDLHQGASDTDLYQYCKDNKIALYRKTTV